MNFEPITNRIEAFRETSTSTTNLTTRTRFYNLCCITFPGKSTKINMGTLSDGGGGDNARKTFDIDLHFGNFRDAAGSFDVTLVADSSNGSTATEALGAHKLILSAASPVLRSLLKEQSRGPIQ